MADGLGAKALRALGKAIAGEMALGQMGEVGRLGHGLIAAAPDVAPELVDLARAELRKKRPDEPLMSAYMALLGSALDVLRLDAELGDARASATIEELKVKLIGLARQGDIDPSFLLSLSRQFSVAKVDMGEALKSLFGAMIGDLDVADRDDADTPEALDGYLADLARGFGGDSFALASELMETAAFVPDENKVAMARGMAFSENVTARDAAIGWLFDASSGVRVAVAGVLTEAAQADRSTPANALRLVAIRNWLPKGERAALDAAIEASRRRGAQPMVRTRAQVVSVHVSGFDGSGAQSSFAVLKLGRTFAIAAVLFKMDFGIRDAWVRRDVTKAETREFLGQAADAVGLYAGSLEFMRTAIPPFMAVGQANGTMPPFGLVDVVETLGLGVVNPAPLSLEDLLAQLTQRLAIDDTTERQAVLVRSARWPMVDHTFMQSWYEAGSEVAALLKGGRLSHVKKVDLIVDKILSGRAGYWAGQLAWSALALLDGGRVDDARDLTIVAAEWLAGRHVPLMRTIAETTVHIERMERR